MHGTVYLRTRAMLRFTDPQTIEIHYASLFYSKCLSQLLSADLELSVSWKPGPIIP